MKEFKVLLEGKSTIKRDWRTIVADNIKQAGKLAEKRYPYCFVIDVQKIKVNHGK